MKGFVQKWQQARMLIGVAMYVDNTKIFIITQSVLTREIGHGDW